VLLLLPLLLLLLLLPLSLLLTSLPQDHPCISLRFRFGGAGGAWWPCSLAKLTNVLFNPGMFLDYFTTGRGMLSSSCCDMGMFGVTRKEYEGRPDIQVTIMRILLSATCHTSDL